MSTPCEPDAAKLFASLFSPDKNALIEVKIELTRLFGAYDWISPELFFDRTQYYSREMGWPLHRVFISFQNLLSPEKLSEIKIQTNEIEKKYVQAGKRLVNIDPGLISAERMVLATGKNYVHRVYLSNGIYADLTLIYKRGSYRPLPWTYPDYADPETITLFNGVRDIYMSQRKEMKRID